MVFGILLSLLAGLAITVGAWLASVEMFRSAWLREEVRHGITAFGGGALISAVAFVLVPEGTAHQSAVSALLSFAAGGVAFMGVDILLARLKSRLAQFFAMMLDFVPEAIVLGVVIGENMAQAVFIALVIAAQNLPEGYAAYGEMAAGTGRKNLLGKFLVVGLSGPLYILLGSRVFVHQPEVLAVMMTFCAGGILYLVFEDIAPRAVMEKHWLPPLGAVLGFMVGLGGYLFT